VPRVENSVKATIASTLQIPGQQLLGYLLFLRYVGKAKLRNTTWI